MENSTVVHRETPVGTQLDYLVLYHQGCCDGYAAALVAYSILRRAPSEVYRILPVNVSQMASEIPKLPYANNVISFDLSFTPATLKQLVDKYSWCGKHQFVDDRLVYTEPVIEVHDHHITTKECLDTEYASHVHFDNNVSGAVLAWRYYYPGVEIPPFLLYVQDRDLWQWRLENSREINSYLQSTMLTRDFEHWLPYLGGDEWNADAVRIGATILNTVKLAIDLICKGSRQRTVDGLRVAVVNSPIYGSEIGDRLARYYDYVVVWRTTDLARVDVSLRSEKGKTDVSQIAKIFGGGGHVSASGFSVPFDTFRDVYLGPVDERVP